MHQLRTCRSLGFESLESRRMLAGNITTSVSNGVLTLTGDVSANAVMIRNSSAGVIQLVGLNTINSTTLAAEPTTVDGVSSELFLNITSIAVNLNDGQIAVNRGNDVVVITSLTIDGVIAVQTGDGNDIVAVGNFDNSGGLVDSAVNSARGAVTIKSGMVVGMGGGTDQLVAKDVTLLGPSGPNFVVNCGVSSTTVTLENVSVAHGANINSGGTLILDMDNFTARNLTILAGPGNDNFTIANSAILQQLMIASGYGDDIVVVTSTTAQNLTIQLGVGNDTLTLTTVNVSQTNSIDGGWGVDTVTISGGGARDLTFNGKQDNDSLTLNSGVYIRNTATITGDTGNDSVSLDTAFIAKLTINLGAGYDSATITGGNIYNVMINGGNGGDTVVLNGLTATKSTISLGAGPDSISLQSVTIANVATIDGGVGRNDTYVDLGSNSIGNLKKKKFEHFI